MEFTVQEVGLGYVIVTYINGVKFETVKTFDTEEEAQDFINRNLVKYQF